MCFIEKIFQEIAKEILYDPDFEKELIIKIIIQRENHGEANSKKINENINDNIVVIDNNV